MSTQAQPHPADLSLARALGHSDPAALVANLWRDPDYVLACLCRYMAREGHTGLYGRTVRQIAETFAYWDPYAGDGQEHRALACLLAHGQGDRRVEPTTNAS